MSKVHTQTVSKRVHSNMAAALVHAGWVVQLPDVPEVLHILVGHGEAGHLGEVLVVRDDDVDDHLDRGEADAERVRQEVHARLDRVAAVAALL